MWSGIIFTNLKNEISCFFNADAREQRFNVGFAKLLCGSIYLWGLFHSDEFSKLLHIRYNIKFGTLFELLIRFQLRCYLLILTYCNIHTFSFFCLYRRNQKEK
jgi:hypothetical protein